MHIKRSFARPAFAVAALALACAAAMPASRAGAQSQPPQAGPTPIPTFGIPINGGATAAPAAAPSATAASSSTPAPRGRNRKGRSTEPQAPEPSGTPTSPAFATLDGSWETQLQYIDRTEYSYIDIKQGDNGALSGQWRVSGKIYPFTGTYDGRTISMLVAGPKGNITMAGYVEAAQDIVGTIDLGDGRPDKTPFTAEHRASSKGAFFKEPPKAGAGSAPAPGHF